MQIATPSLRGNWWLKLVSSATLLAATWSLQISHLPAYSADLETPSESASTFLVSQALDWNSALRVARLTNANQQVTDLVLQLDVFNKPTTTYANVVYQVLAKTESSDWQVIHTNRGARLLPSNSGSTTLAPEVIPIADLLDTLKAEFGQDIELDDVELNCVAQIRYDLPGGRRDLKETFEFTQSYTALLLAATTEIAGLFTTTTASTTTTTTATTTPQASVGVYDDRITLSNGYRVTLMDVVFNQTSSTWRYYVEELPVAQDLSNWVLGLPPCATLISATPRGELVNPDPNARISGIKWQPGGGFVEGEFSVTLAGALEVGAIQVAVKGPDVVVGTMSGPTCR